MCLDQIYGESPGSILMSETRKKRIQKRTRVKKEKMKENEE